MRKQAEHLKNSVDAAKEAADDFKLSIAEAVRSADAMQRIADSTVENVRQLKEVFAMQRNTFELQLRAYLVFSPRMYVAQDRGQGLRYRVDMFITNVGHTPARGVKCAIRVLPLDYPIPADFDPAVSLNPIQKTNLGDIGANQRPFISAYFSDFVSDEDAKEIADAIRRRLYVFGTIWYKDAFDNPRHTNFCGSVTYFGKELAVWTTDRHNDAT
jgi:hypothetical protein